MITNDEMRKVQNDLDRGIVRDLSKNQIKQYIPMTSLDWERVQHYIQEHFP